MKEPGMKDSDPNLSRRGFLGQASCAAVGTASLFSSILNLRLVGSVAAAEAPLDDEYRALVCVFLAGGNDSFNMLAPYSGDGRAEYLASRGSVAVPASGLLALPAALADGRLLGVHGSMPELHALYGSGKAAFLANVGTLVEPTSLARFQNGLAKLPLGLFSHSDQQMHWQSSLPETRSPATGWGGRLSDLVTSLNDAGPVSMNVSVAGINLFQSGAQTTALAVSDAGVTSLTDWTSGSFLPRRQAMESLLEAEYRNVFERTFASMKRQAIDASAVFSSALAGAPAIASPFTQANPLAKQLQMVAKSISARNLLGKRRQTFFVLMGGWDLHAGMASHGALLQKVSQAVGEFQAAMSELGIAEKVTLFSASDFGRTLSPNGSGTDHAWGGNQFVVGGAVNGGRVYGSYPELSLGSSLDTGRGRLIPTTSVDAYFAELALWMGVSPSNLPLVLPNFARFHDPLAGPPLGFLMGAPPP
jgi:uncharacterized protein (DUF1501 family)